MVLARNDFASHFPKFLEPFARVAEEIDQQVRKRLKSRNDASRSMIYEKKMSCELNQVIKIPQKPIVAFVDQNDKTN